MSVKKFRISNKIANYSKRRIYYFYDDSGSCTVMRVLFIILLWKKYYSVEKQCISDTLALSKHLAPLLRTVIDKVSSCFCTTKHAPARELFTGESTVYMISVVVLYGCYCHTDVYAWSSFVSVLFPRCTLTSTTDQYSGYLQYRGSVSYKSIANVGDLVCNVDCSVRYLFTR